MVVDSTAKTDPLRGSVLLFPLCRLCSCEATSHTLHQPAVTHSTLYHLFHFTLFHVGFIEASTAGAAAQKHIYQLFTVRPLWSVVQCVLCVFMGFVVCSLISCRSAGSANCPKSFSSLFPRACFFVSSLHQFCSLQFALLVWIIIINQHRLLNVGQQW